jgi:acyl carrier protein
VLLDKEQIVNLLRNEGQGDQADRAQLELPDVIDTQAHADYLSELGLDSTALSSLGGGLTDMFGP